MLTARQLIDLVALGDGSYRSQHILDNGTGTIFGGQLLALSLAAAQREAPAWPVHSISANFLRNSNVGIPLQLDVVRSSDTRRFASRHVVASQPGQTIFEMLCSFHEPEPGIRYQAPFAASDVPGPANLPNLAQFGRDNAGHFTPQTLRFYTQPFPVEMRLVDPDSCLPHARRSPRRDYWFRIESAADVDDPQDHQALLALMSDYWLPSTGSALYAGTGAAPRLVVLSLNHSMRFHAPARVDQWLLYSTETVWAGNGRALAQGRIYDAGLQLVASTSQEYLLRELKGQ
jgi:acyl-CoA thioesterase-2